MSNLGLISRIRCTPQPSTPVLAVSKLFFCIIAIAQIAIGAVHLHDCPRKHYIPIYLIVVGVFGLMLSLFSCLPCTKTPEDGSISLLNLICTMWNCLTSLFLFCWFIAGNVWIYSIYQPNYNKNSTDVDPYCDRTPYLFAFSTTTLVYIIFILGVCFVCSAAVTTLGRNHS
ncbi:transmembrane protein 272-like isoform X3 [Trematomus bernacchii]|uniref:transmembrane protein 272-like isoform X3 n=1 Tax=Trematomus bernacchii TaxID=40690 RepID=UPI00146ADE68|nr:transmembrane protein 272-like isoform X3 [Trematomus bernacchii]